MGFIQKLHNKTITDDNGFYSGSIHVW